MKIDLMELDAALATVNKGSFVSFDTDTAKCGSKTKNDPSELWTRKVTKGIVANVSTSYRDRVLKANPDYKFTPKSYYESVGESSNILRHKDNGTLYFSMPFNPQAKTARAKSTYFYGATKNGPWVECSYEKQQSLLNASDRDDYKDKSGMAEKYPLIYRMYKAESLTGFRAAKQEFIAA